MNHYVLFVSGKEVEDFISILYMETGLKGIYPKFEYYRRDNKSIAEKPLFPGYVFVKSDLDQLEFSKKIEKMEIKKGFIKELKYEENIPCLSEEEIAVLKKLLNYKGILKMSYGYLENRRIVITEGPLVGFENYITKLDKHNHLVYFDLYFFENQRWKAGLTVEDRDEK